jgi:hypothetical protein
MKIAFHLTSTKYITDSASLSPTLEDIIDAFSWLIKGATKGDVLFLSYSGNSETSACIMCPNGDSLSVKDIETNLFSLIPSGVTLLFVYDSQTVPKDLVCRHKIICTNQWSGLSLENGWKYPKSFSSGNPSETKERSEIEETHFLLLILTSEGAPRGALSFAAQKSLQYTYSHSLTCSQFVSDITSVFQSNAIKSQAYMECGQWIDSGANLGRIFALPI